MHDVIEHVFVLVLENRSFDHMLGWSGLSGSDAVTGLPTVIDGLTGGESNLLPDGTRAPIERGAPYALDADPSHEFSDVLEQLCGTGTVFTRGAAYPPITNGGFAARFAMDHPDVQARDGNVTMKAYTPEQLPVLNALAREFAVCDHWFSALPGPTWPNRFFIHAASSAGLDGSPSPLRSATAVLDGYRFANGTVFDAVERTGKHWYVIEGDAIPQCLALHGMVRRVESHFIGLPDLRDRLSRPGFDGAYVFIEPSYGHVFATGAKFKDGSSQHPEDDVTRGEALIKDVYETIRASQYWERSLLIVTYDEHGGFYDHVAPPPATPPGDRWLDASVSTTGFQFDRLGVRVPAVVISPLIPRGTIDHRVHDHSSVSATLRETAGTLALTRRDLAATGVAGLATLTEPRADTPLTLPDPAVSGIAVGERSFAEDAVDLGHALSDVLHGAPAASLVGFLHVAMLRHVELLARDMGGIEAAAGRAVQEVARMLESVQTTLHARQLLDDVHARWSRHTGT